jgi:hypothetical protein
MSFPIKYFVDVGEALGFFNTLQWIADMQFDSVEFAIDLKVTDGAFNSNHREATKFGQVITTCQNPFSTSITNSRVELVGNKQI